MNPPSRPQPGRARRALRLALKIFLGLVATGVTLVVVAAFVGTRTSAGRRWLIGQINGALDPSMRGIVVVDGIDQLGLRGLEGLSVTVADEHGTLLAARRVSVAISPLALLKGALFTKGEQLIPLDRVTADEIYVDLSADESGSMRLARAFEPTKPPPPDKPPSKPTHVVVGSARLGRVYVRGEPAPAVSLDADLSNLDASIDLVGPKGRAEVRALHVVARKLPRAYGAEGDFVASADWDEGVEPEGKGSFRGKVGGMPLFVEGLRERSGFVSARAEIPRSDPSLWNGLVPELPLVGELGVNAKVEGPRDALAFDVEARVDEGVLRAKGKAAAVGEPQVEGRIELERLAPRSFAPTAPAVVVGGSAEGKWSFAPGGGGWAKASLSTPGGDGLPAASLVADVKGTLEALEAHAKIDAQGAKANVNATTATEGGGTVVRGDAEIVAPALGQFSALGLRSGSLRARAHGSFASASGAVSAQANVEARGVSRGTERVEAATVEAEITGTATAPQIELEAQARGVSAGGRQIGNSLSASARVRVGEGVVVEEPRLLVRSAGQLATLTASSVEARGEHVVVRNVLLAAGQSRLRADARIEGSSTSVRATCRDLDLAALSRFVQPSPAVMGHVSCEIDAEIGPGGVRGEGRVAWRGVDVPKVDVFDGEVEFGGEGKQLRVTARATSKHLGEFVLREAEVDLGAGSALEPAAWERATGAASLTARIPLPEALAIVDPQGERLRASAGKIELEARVRREDAALLPTVSVDALSKGVALVLPDGPLRGVDARVAARFEGKTREAYLGAELYDARGMLARVEGVGEVPEAVLRGNAPRDLALSTPFEFSVNVPERRVRELPYAARYARGDERVTLTAAWKGSLQKPALDLRACLADVEAPEGGGRFTLDLRSSYDGRLARVDATARHARRAIADVAASAEVSAADLIGRGAEAPWTAGATARFHDTPLSALPPLNGRPWGGRLNGELTVENLHRDAKARGWIVAEGLRLGDASYEYASFEGSVEGGMARAHAQIRQKQGGATLEAEVPARWGAEIAPTPDLMAGWRARATARSLRLSPLGALTPAAISDLDGVADADVAFEAKNGGTPQGEGRVALRKGKAFVVALGQGFHDIEGRLSLTREGRVSVEGLSARGTTGRLQGSASGQVSATGDASINGTLRVARGEPVPVTFEGETLGEASGEFGLKARVVKASARTEVEVDVRSLYLRLSETSANDLQSLELHDDVRVGVSRPEGNFELVPLAKPPKAKPSPSEREAGPAATMRVAINLGEVLIVRGTEVRVGVRGKLTAEMTEEMSLNGQIRLQSGGYFEVQGRRFRVENGTVSFSGGDVSDATVIATASWNAPDGTKVFADFVGPVSSGRLTLRSEPSRSPNEIVALLVFGTADSASAFQSNKNQGSGTGGLPVSAGGAIAAKGLNNALYRLTKLDVQARLDTSQGNPRPEVVVPLSPSLSLEVSHVIGMPPPGQSPDRNFVALEWRFRRRWALETSAGDRGRTALDTFWTYSY